MASEGFGVETAYLFGEKLADGIIREGCDADGIGGGGLTTHCIVGVGNVGRGVGVVHGEQLSPSVITIGRHTAAGVGAGGEAAVIGVGVGEALAVGVGLGEEDARGFVIRPCGGVAHAGGLVAIGRHGGLVAEEIVGVADGIGGAALIGSVTPQVIFIGYDIAEGIGNGDGLPHHVVTVGRDGADGIGD